MALPHFLAERKLLGPPTYETPGLTDETNAVIG